jgi:archaellin
MTKRILVSVASAGLGLALLASCGGNPGGGNPGADDPVATQLQALITQAEGMTNQELFQKAIEESNGQTMYGIGNSSRGATAAEAFIAALKAIDPSYTGTIEWSQPKNNSIFTTLNADINSAQHQFSMTLIQDGSQIQSKMINTGNLFNFIPQEWKESQGVDLEKNGTPLTLQTISKVFEYNNLSGKTYTNVWQFVAPGEKPLFMGVNSEPVGKNFLYMLTSEKYSTAMKDAFDALPDAEKSAFQPTIDAMAEEAASLGLAAPNAQYGLAWVKLWAEQYNEQTDDGPIANELVTTSAAGETGLLVYSKLRSIEESATSSVKNITVAAYQDDYTGPGGYAYKHYLMMVKTAPLPWTGMAFNAFMATSKEGFDAWGKDIGGWSANPAVNQDHTNDGGTEFPAMNDKGYDWWLADDGGALVLEDPVYAAQVAPVMSDWIDMIVGNKS